MQGEASGSVNLGKNNESLGKSSVFPEFGYWQCGAAGLGAWTLPPHLVPGDFESDFYLFSISSIPSGKSPLWVCNPSSCVPLGVTKIQEKLLAVPSSGPSSLLLLLGWELPPSIGFGIGFGHLWVLLVPPGVGLS